MTPPAGNLPPAREPSGCGHRRGAHYRRPDAKLVRMPSNRWVDRTQPQTLMMATVLMYINAALGVLFGLAFVSPLLAILVLGPVAAGWGIANEKKWGYWAGVVLTVFDLLFTIRYFSGESLITLLFYAALLGLLLHPQSREYRRTWFRW